MHDRQSRVAASRTLTAAPQHVLTAASDDTWATLRHVSYLLNVWVNQYLQVSTHDRIDVTAHRHAADVRPWQRRSAARRRGLAGTLQRTQH